MKVLFVGGSDFIVRVAPRLAGTLLGDKRWSVLSDNSKIRRFVPEFEVITPFREGIRRTLAWYEADEQRQRMDEATGEEMAQILRAYARRSAECPTG